LPPPIITATPNQFFGLIGIIKEGLPA
jgi:hypothetical protein